MDPTVPRPAAHILPMIYRGEVGRSDRAGYDVIYGHNQGKIRPLTVTTMTVDQVIAEQQSWINRFGGSATGAPQFLRKTLQGLKSELNLRGGQVLDPNLQDRLAYHLMRRRHYDKWIVGQISNTTFGNNLAKEWASLPVLNAMQGHKVWVNRGESYYSGYGGNKSHIAPEEVERVLREAKQMDNAPPAPEPVPPEPVPPPDDLMRWDIAALAALDWAVLGPLHAKIAGAAFYKAAYDGRKDRPVLPLEKEPVMTLPAPPADGRPFYQTRRFWGAALTLLALWNPAIGDLAETLLTAPDGTSLVPGVDPEDTPTLGGLLLWLWGSIRAQGPIVLSQKTGHGHGHRERG